MRLDWLLPEIKGIPVLMYHRVWPALSDGLTLTPEQLREQWLYLKKEGYEALGLQDFIAIMNGERNADGKKVLLTFDDGYRNNLEYVYPLLKEIGWRATFFIIAETLHGRTNADDPLNRKMSAEELKQLDPDIVQLAMHGYHHENFTDSNPDDIRRAITRSITAFREMNIPLHKALAYPYGARPKEQSIFKSLKQWMRDQGIEAGFRIGNRVAPTPAKDIYEIRRIDIRGTDSLEDFKIKLRKGKLKPF